MKAKNMTTLVQEYLSHRRSMGFKLRAEGELLMSFCRYADKRKHRGPLTSELAVSWAKESRSVLHRARRLHIVRGLAEYRALFDPKTEVPPKGLLGSSRYPRRFYIYTDQELADLLREAKKLRSANPLMADASCAVFGLLACSGLRVSEALNLTDEDVDLTAGILRINRSKFEKSRLVPIHYSTLRALTAWKERRDGRLNVKPKSFFVGDAGETITYSCLRQRFGRIRQRLGWSEKKQPPRIHDLRHAFAVRKLLEWHQNGENLDRKILNLSTYLGHVNVTKTYWYLTAVPELLAIVGNRFERFARDQLRGDL